MTVFTPHDTAIVDPQTAYPRLLGLLAVVLIHLAALILLGHAISSATPVRPTHESVVLAFLQPRVREPQETHVDQHLFEQLAAVRFPMPALDIPQPTVDVSVDRNGAAMSVAPTLEQESAPAIAPYVRQAALRPGEGATVVLRVEVLNSGDPGAIAVDVSSGSTQVDQAAVDYARARHWHAGRMNGAPSTMWIRWGVRLQA